MTDGGGSLPWRRFTLITSLLIVCLVVGIVIGSFGEAEERVRSDELYRARSYFTQIVLTRKWNAGYGGVYVMKSPGVESNPYLKHPDVALNDGRVLTLRNPAFMTRELSEIAARDGLFTFKITSLKPVNPKNAPDEFEQRALESFDRGEAKEVIRLEKRGDRSINRYIAPLVTEQSCLLCHEEHGYKIGDIRGGISVEFDVTEIRRLLAFQRFAFTLVSALALTGILAAVLVLIKSLRRRLDTLNARILEIAVTDELTGLANRRRFMDRLAEESARAVRTKHPFAVAIFDVDFFKAVNDAYGHPVGDAVLKEVAERMAACVRGGPDLIARYGGEEFSVVLTDARGAEALRAADRIRAAVCASPVHADGKAISVTISGGVAEVAPDAPGAVESALSAADRALYRAKEAGRNRVEIADRAGAS